MNCHCVKCEEHRENQRAIDRSKQPATATTNKKTAAMTSREVAWEAATNLFTNGAGRKATRLVLVDESGGTSNAVDLGGLCQAAVADRIEAALTTAKADAQTEMAKKMIEAVRTTRILSDEIHELPQGGTITEVQIPFTAAGFKEQAIAALEAVARAEGIEILKSKLGSLCESPQSTLCHPTKTGSC